MKTVPKIVSDDDYVEKVHALIHEDYSLTVYEVAEEAGMSKSLFALTVSHSACVYMCISGSHQHWPSCTEHV